MTSQESNLARELALAFKGEVGALSESWAVDSSELRKQLLVRARRVREKLPGKQHDRGTARRAMLALRLVELVGADLPEELDLVLACALGNFTPENARSFGSAAVRALDALPETRRAPLRMALAGSAVQTGSDFSRPRLHLVIPELAPEACAALRKEVAARKPGDLNGHPPLPTLLEGICRFSGASTLPEELYDPLRLAFNAFLKVEGRQHWGWIANAFKEALGLLDAERLERLLLFRRAPWPWEFYALHPSPAVLDRVLENLGELPGMDSPELVTQGLRQLGAALAPRLFAYLETHREPRGVPLAALAVELVDAAQLGALLRFAERVSAPEVRQQLAARLRDVDLVALHAAALDAWEAISPGSRALVAEVVAFRAWAEAVGPTVEALRARTPSDEGATLRLLEQAEARRSGDSTEARRAALTSLYLARHHLDPALIVLQDQLAGERGGVGSSWEQLAAHPASAIVAWGFICGHVSHYVEGATTLMQQRFGRAALAHAARFILRAASGGHEDIGSSTLNTICAWLVEQPAEADDDAIHLGLLERGGVVLQELAAGALARSAAPPVEALAQLLGHRQASARAGAARALERIGAPRAEAALEALQAAARKERAKAPREAMQAALGVLDPRWGVPREQPLELGAWQSVEGLNARELMTELRDVLYQKPDAPLWSRVCDLLARLELVGALEPGADYVRAHIDAWPSALRPAPWAWEGHPVLKALVGPFEGGRYVLPVAALYGPQRQPFLDEVLHLLERGERARTFRPGLVDLFLQAVHAGWAFCQLHHVPLHSLEVGVDGGSVRKAFVGQMPSTTRMELVEGFGAQLVRTTARREEAARGPGLRYVQLSVPPRHPLREAHGLKPRQRMLDILPMLNLPE